MNFRKELNSIKEKDYQLSIKNKYDVDYILKNIVLTYLRYLVCADLISGKVELVFSVKNIRENILEIILKTPADNFTGNIIYYKYFPKKQGAIISIRKIQEIFRKENFEIKPYHNIPGYIPYYEKRFSIFIEFK